MIEWSIDIGIVIAFVFIIYLAGYVGYELSSYDKEGRPVRIREVTKTDKKTWEVISIKYSIEAKSHIWPFWVTLESSTNLEKIKREYERLKKEVGKEKPKIRSKSKVLINSKDK
jgi:hypothetical protein